jgi:hypothetical protein
MPQAEGNRELLFCEPYWIENNAWGYDGERPPQRITTPPGKPLGWSWDWPGHDDTVVMAYPEIIFGKKPWLQSSSTPMLPIRLDALERLRATYVADMRIKGAYNLAFELWLTSAAEAHPEHIVAEVMIWVDGERLSPAGDCVASFQTTYGTVDLFRSAMQHWRYYAFVLRKAMPAGVLDLRQFVDHLLRNGEIDTGLYLASVEFGNEIAWGRGRTELARYTIDLSTHSGSSGAGTI